MDNTYIKIDKISPDPEQPRKYFPADKMAKLKASIKRYGIQQPLIVEKDADGMYSIIDGERRWRTAKELGLTEVPIRLIQTKNKLDKLVQQFHIQDQHESWTGVEKANAMMKLSNELNLPLKFLCEELAISASEAERYLAYANLQDREAFQRSEIPIGWAKYFQQIRSAAKRLYQAEYEEEFDAGMQKKLERALINRAADGVIKRDSDFSKIKDSFTKEPKSIMNFIEDAKITPDALFLKTKAKGAFSLRNVVNHSGYITNHAAIYLQHKDVKPTAAAIRVMKHAHEGLAKVLALVDTGDEE